MIFSGIIQGLFSYPQVSTGFELHYKKTPYNEELLSKCPIIKKQQFRPTPWFPFGKMHLTLGRIFDKKPSNEIYKREIIKIPRNGEISIDWIKDSIKRSQPKKKAFVFISPDLASVSYTRHIRQFALDIHDQGYITGVYHVRGVQGSEFAFPEDKDAYINWP